LSDEQAEQEIQTQSDLNSFHACRLALKFDISNQLKLKEQVTEQMQFLEQ
jgi:predicted phage-related endonuclease